MTDPKLKLSGIIKDFPLIEVVQFLEMNKKNGALHISTEVEDERLTLFFKQGNLVHATSNKGAVGETVFYYALSVESGSFKFITGEEAPQVTIDMPLNTLLLESQRRLDELAHLQNFLPTDESVLYIQPYIHDEARLTSSEWLIISMINGRRTIRKICRKVGDELYAKKTIRELFAKQYIDMLSGNEKWKELIPLAIPASEVTTERPYPPLLRTNSLLRVIDGRTKMKDMVLKLSLKENELLEDIKLLHETQWITFSSGDEKIFTQLQGEGELS